MLGVYILAAGLVPAIGIAGDDTDMAVAEAGGLELANGEFGRGIVVINACESFRHRVIL